jgi:filamentous hemagglutinin family protein
MRFLNVSRWRHAVLVFGTILSSALVAGPGSVVTDGTLGTARAIAGPNYAITQSVGQTVGSNLFHSFATFNIGTGETATFSSVTPVSNVIARVTGSASSIDGLIACTISGANLFLINPQGISFGANAALNVSGSFFASTADYVTLGTTGRFDATTPGNSVLTSAPPSAFGFVGPSPAPISVSGSFLSVPAGQTLSLVGGDISLTNFAELAAYSGRINLASIASSGEVALGATNISTSGVSHFGTIKLDSAFLIVDTDATTGGASGSVFIRGGQLTLTNGSQISSANSASTQGGSISIASTNLSVDSDGLIQSVAFGPGNAGSINLQVGALSLTGGGQIAGVTFDAGQGGSIVIAANGPIMISGSGDFGPSSVFTLTTNTGNAGSISVAAPSMSLDSGGRIFSETTGSITGSGSAGNIGLQLGTFSLIGGGQIRSVVLGTGQGGSVAVTATGAGAISGEDGFGNSSGVLVVTQGSGNAGNIDLQVGALSLTNGGLITADTSGTGQGGSVSVTASGPITISGTGSLNASGIFANSLSLIPGTGNAGSIAVTTPALSLDGGALIQSATQGPGNAGNINLQLGTLALNGGSEISASTLGSGHGGSALITATGPVNISGSGSGVFANSRNPATGNPATGDAGMISITAPSLNLDSSALIQSRTEGMGNAGNINLQLGALSLTNGGQIATDTLGAGLGGSVTVIATGPISISGTDGFGNPSGMFSNSNDTATGNAGLISVTAPSLSLSSDGSIQSVTKGLLGNAGNINLQLGTLSLASGGEITADTHGAGQGGSIAVTATGSVNISGADNSGNPSLVSSASHSSATGNAGSISIITPSLSVTNGGLMQSKSDGIGTGGAISISAGDILLSNGGTISAASHGTGNAGSLLLSAANSLKLLDGGQVTTEATLADGGNIEIHAGTLVYLLDSKITTSVGTGKGNGGNITIDPVFVVLQGSQISANAFGGNGGNINIIADNFLKSPDSSVTASSQLGISGTVFISAPIVDFTGRLVTLLTPYLNISNLLAERCAARLAGKASSFVLAGRGGLPVEPDGPLPSAALTTLSPIDSERSGEAATMPLALSNFDFGCSK